MSSKSKDGAAASGTSTRYSRRSARRCGHDNPVIAPGFGTRQDIEKLSKDLNVGSDSALPVAAVEAMMNSRGRGILSPAPKEGNAKPGATSSAWADFMQEEGVDLGFATAASTSTAAMTTAAVKGDDEATPTKAATSNKRKAYNLEVLAQPAPCNKKAKTAKGAKSGPLAGALLQTGTLDVTLVGRKTAAIKDASYHLQIPTRILPSVKITKVFTSCNAVHSIALDHHGQAYGWGRNDLSALSSSLPANVVLPTLLEGLEGKTIQAAALGKSHTLVLTHDGKVFSVGSNKSGQCGIKSSVETVNNWRESVFAAASLDINVVQIACGEQFSVALTDQGQMYSTGASEFGQLGNGETGEYFVAASKLAFSNCNLFTLRNQFMERDPAHSNSKHTSSKTEKLIAINDDIRIQAIACGKHHTVAVEADYEVDAGEHATLRVFSWGCGDYGCLGHGVQADEYFPREITAFGSSVWLPPGNLKVSAGAHCSLLKTANGHVYYWGKHRSVGEATMRPHVVEALANNQHNVSHCAAGGQTVVCSTTGAQMVAWGQGPHGELGLGNPKSSAKPQFVDTLTGCRILDLACGYGHTLVVVTDEDAEDKVAIDKLPIVDPNAPEEIEAAWATAESAKPKAKSGKKR